ncbi:unnamed protein product [Peronospora belbahrii]|uniref:Transcription and mRNA export factor ENY2 n=1 Tax=Peronospora belbahrii TaxID=622444 RepID=A0ABN8CJY3_9STRA|nr:unnamed protein product [Peronospora belbahrii]
MHLQRSFVDNKRDGQRSLGMNDAEIKMRISERFVQSGVKDQVKELLRVKLVDCGWRDEMKLHCKEVIRKKGIDHVTVEDLVEEITLKARALVPGDVKNEILQKITIDVKEQIGSSIAN